jgi:hypothetical protein
LLMLLDMIQSSMSADVYCCKLVVGELMIWWLENE